MEKLFHKLEEYKNILNFEDEYYKKDYKNNFKFISYCVRKMIKRKEKEEDIILFLEQVIKNEKQVKEYLETPLNEYVEKYMLNKKREN